MGNKRPHWRWLAVASLSASLLPGYLLAQSAPPPPTSRQKSAPPPVEQFKQRKLHSPPPLRGSAASVEAFVAWAGRSAPVEREDGRKAIRAAMGRPGVAKALCAEVFQAITSDHTRALLVLSMLGELRDRGEGRRCLSEVVRIPAPAKGRVERESGRVLGAESLEALQAKAVDGLAYLRVDSADEEVLQIAASHPSRAVRAEAVEAYLWNHGDSEQARRLLKDLLPPGDEALIQRVRREDGETAASFDFKIAGFIKDYPDLQPPSLVPACIPNRPNETPSQDPGRPPGRGYEFRLNCGVSPTCNGICPDGQTCTANGQLGCTCR